MYFYSFLLYCSFFFSQNEEIATEGELRSHSMDDTERVRELQDKVADLQAEVRNNYIFKKHPQLTASVCNNTTA